jgi:hypothetical protein
LTQNDDPKVKVTERARDRGYWTPIDLAEMSGLSGARIRQLLAEGTVRGDKAGPFWTIPYREGRRWLSERELTAA